MNHPVRIGTAWWQRLDHRKPAALLLGAAAGLYGTMILNLLPSFVTAWAGQLHLSESTAGGVATINLLSHACGLGVALFLVTRWPLPRIFHMGIVLAVFGDGGSVFASNLQTLQILRALAGLGLGMQFGTALN